MTITAATNNPEPYYDLMDAIDRLPDNSRQVILLHDVDGYSCGEIAERMGVAEQTIRVWRNRAKKELVALL